MLNHFDKFLIIYCFFTIIPQKMTINCFYRIMRSFSTIVRLCRFPEIEALQNKLISKILIVLWKFPIIKKQNQFFHRSDGSIIFKYFEGNNLGNNHGFLMFLVWSITSTKVTLCSLLCNKPFMNSHLCRDMRSYHILICWHSLRAY